VVQFSFPVVWVFLLRRQRPGGVRLPREGLASGVWWGVVLFAFIWGVYLTALRGSDLAAAAAPRIQSRVEAIGAGTPLRFLLLTLGLSVAHSFLEEYYWRWFLFGRLRNLTGSPAALIASSLAFAAHHVIVLHAFIGFGRFWWATVLLSIAVALGGGLWAWLYARHGSLYPPWLSHTMVDLAIMAIGYDLVWGLV
jgi:membrane protease YdiL (CAAX protease family)